MCIPNCLHELKSALLINTSIMRLWQYWLHVEDIPFNVSSTHSTYSNIPSFPLQFIFHSWDKKYFLFFTCLIFDFFIFLNPKRPLQIYKYLFAIWLSTFRCLKTTYGSNSNWNLICKASFEFISISLRVTEQNCYITQYLEFNRFLAIRIQSRDGQNYIQYLHMGQIFLYQLSVSTNKSL